jgi:hypothetical protein
LRRRGKTIDREERERERGEREREREADGTHRGCWVEAVVGR